MPQYGLCLRVTHTGKAGDSVHVSDIRDGVDLLASFRKAGPVYIPHPRKGGVAVLVYSGDVAVSYESGGIRKFIEGGYLTAEFVVGSPLDAVLGPPIEILDEAVSLTLAVTSIDFVGPGVTATNTGTAVTVTIPGGGGGGGDHATLSNLGWLASAHTGPLNTLSGFDGAGATTTYSRTVTGDVTGTYPGPLTVTDFTISGEVWGDVLYFDGTNWVRLPAGTAGEVLTTAGAGANPSWAAASGVSDHALLTNLDWTSSGHTDDAGSLAAFTAAGAASLVTGVSQGDVLYFNGTDWSRLAPGTGGEFLQTQGAGSDPLWAVPTGFTWKQPVDVKGYLGTRTVAEIDLLAPTVGQSIVAGSAGTPTAGTSDLLAVGDVAEFDGTAWKKILGSVGGFPPAGTRALVETDPITLYSPLVDGTDEGKCVEWDGTSLTPSLVTPVDGDAVLVKGEGSVNENKQYVFDGVVPSGEWVQFGGGGLSHAALSGLGWLVSGHMGTVGSLAAFDGAGASSFITGVSQGDLLYFDGTTWVRLPPGSVDGNPLTTQTAGAPPTWDTTIAVDTITESTADNGVVVNEIRNYGKSAGDPVGPSPAAADGDTYYNTSLRMNMVYDGLRSKWLSSESTTFHFGRDGNTKADQYYRAADGRVMSATNGWYAERSGTVISMAYTRTNADAANFDIMANGASLTTVASSAIGGRDIAINEDFTFGQILAVMNQTGGGATTSNVIAHIRVKWRA